MTDKKQTKITVSINRKSYTIVGSESRKHVELIAELVDDKMNAIYVANKQLDSTGLAVLTALNTMNDYVKLKEDYDDLLTLLEEEN